MSERIDYQATSPAGIKALGGVYAYIQQSGLDPALVELVYLRVSQINGCAYCLDLHTKDLVKQASLPGSWRWCKYGGKRVFFAALEKRPLWRGRRR